MKNEERFIVTTVKSFCAGRGLSCFESSQGWLLHLGAPPRSKFVMGYDIGLNASSGQQVAKDKCATFEVLHAAGIPAVEHRIFHGPALTGYVSLQGNWRVLSNYLGDHPEGIVCKPVEGTGGQDVILVRSQLALEDATQRLLSKNRSFCVSPFHQAHSEYRAIVLDGVAEIVFEKVRPSIGGDGTSNILALIADFRRRNPHISGELQNALDGTHVPNAGEVVEIEWRHNLALGAVPIMVGNEASAEISKLAVSAAGALGLRFSSVDLIDDGVLRVLEINSGVMMESFARQTPEFEALARRTYFKALSCVTADL